MINIPLLKMLAVSALGYSRRDTRFLTVGEICDQYGEYCRLQGMEPPP